MGRYYLDKKDTVEESKSISILFLKKQVSLFMRLFIFVSRIIIVVEHIYKELSNVCRA
jgi:hypothetical protein